MILPLLFSMILVTQPIKSEDHLVITKNGQPIITINRMDFFLPYTDLPLINKQNYEQLLDQIDKEFSTEPQNASLDSNENIVKERIGIKVHRQLFTEQFYSKFFSYQHESLELPMLTVYPEVDSELLSDIRSMRIGRYVTSFNARNKKRSTNIQLATEAINNDVVFPGETFSFNKAVGKRTASKGYLRAPVIVRGEFSEDIGGGICQVSSTLFNAVDNAGLKIVQRYSHSRKVPYIPPGRDATVSWYGPDFEFLNSYNQPVLIRARTMGNYLIISIYSSENIKYIPRKVPGPAY
ncbi:VanW family protein [Neobacillus jeddahensis]|uniref:VanW family protein n=1 Tax=Neobacillus jeddahensis TaxID=1461580 RepID=UPI00058B80BB|nr:VanW family protein [Neobacillus jeddahensis]